MIGLYMVFKTLLIIIWLIDILDIDFVINEIHIASLLDITIPINTLFWLLLWLFIPSISYTKEKD